MSQRPMSPRAQPTSTHWLATYLIAAAALLGLGGLKVMVTYGPWMITVIALTLAVSIVVAMTRRLTSSRWMSSVVGAGTAVLLLMWTSGLRSDGPHHALRSPGAFADLARGVESGAAHANASVIPVDVNNEFSALVGANVLALFNVWPSTCPCRGISPATSGLPLLLPWLPTLTPQQAPDYVDDHMAALGQPLSENARATLGRVTLAVSDARYSSAESGSGSDSYVASSRITKPKPSGHNGNEAGLVRDARGVRTEVQAAHGRMPRTPRVGRSMGP